jgi:hypothetical protein
MQGWITGGRITPSRSVFAFYLRAQQALRLDVSASDAQFEQHNQADNVYAA